MGEPLSTLLSWVLIAATIEIDNAFEASMPHRSAASRAAGEVRDGPWLASVASWYACLQHLPAGGLPLDELDRRSFGESHLRGTNPGFVRWGYVTLEPTDDGPVVRPTPAGERAQARWAELGAAVEPRWVDRFGAATMAELRAALEAIDGALDADLPDYVPQNAGHRPRLTVEARPRVASTALRPGATHLPALLTHALLPLTATFEADGEVALVLAANLLRPLAAGVLAMRDLARAAGIARETLSVITNVAAKQDLLVIEPAARGKAVRLTDRGRAQERATAGRLAAAESDLRSRVGDAPVAALRAALTSIIGGDDLALSTSPLRAAVEPPPEGWRARVRAPDTLPHHPAVSHRGSYPDGS